MKSQEQGGKAVMSDAEEEESKTKKEKKRQGYTKIKTGMRDTLKSKRQGKWASASIINITSVSQSSQSINRSNRPNRLFITKSRSIHT